MRITGNVDTSATNMNKSIFTSTQTVENVVKQGSDTTMKNVTFNVEQGQQLSDEEDIKVKVQEAVEKMNTMLEVNHNTAKFKYHEGLDRYYITVVDRETDEVVKEIPPKKLLDAFYEMQKMLGMIVDEKI
ncbi:flagellar protein FlaG [Lysinibacillus piscis]|uniref:Flagellar protein FlaG n=1 Tax=Lysinibacillus piscis TaxID=2518931 RepID=A0ABQ5NHD8_9BACI|nr:flagellar protein FlaG [Lysinibacillus sp. KH24]GLC87790.1 flagellar protein FlaG [Lysinibacillus sp. KH24]